MRVRVGAVLGLGSWSTVMFLTEAGWVWGKISQSHGHSVHSVPRTPKRSCLGQLGAGLKIAGAPDAN